MMKTSGVTKAGVLNSIFWKVGFIVSMAVLLLAALVVSFAQTCCSGGVPQGGSLGLHWFAFPAFYPDIEIK